MKLGRFRREPLASMARVVSTDYMPSAGTLRGAASYEIADLRLQERAKQEANMVGDFVSNHVVSVDVISNPVKMFLYKAAIERFLTMLPAGMIRIFVDAAIAAEMQTRREVAAARAKQQRATSAKAA